MSRKFEKEYARANDRIHPRRDLLADMEQKWAAETARAAAAERKRRSFPAWAKYAALAAGILLCVGLGMESMVLFGRSKGIQNKTAAADAPVLAKGAMDSAAEARAEEAPIHFEASADAATAAEEDAPEPEAMVMAEAYLEAPGLHYARDEAEVEDAVRHGRAEAGLHTGAARKAAEAPLAGDLAMAAEAPESVQGYGFAAGGMIRRDDMVAVFLPTADEVHVIRFDGRKVENLFALTLRERDVRIEKVFWLGDEFLALREKNGDTELLRFAVADFKSPRHLMNLTQSGTLLAAGDLGGRACVLSLYEADEAEPLPWVDGARLDYDRALVDRDRPSDAFTLLSVYAPGGDGFAGSTALLGRGLGTAMGDDRLLVWTQEGGLYAFALQGNELTLRAESALDGHVLAAAVTSAGYGLVLETGDDVRYAALDGDLQETASAAMGGAGPIRSAAAYDDGGMVLTRDALHVLTAAGDRSLAVDGDGFRRLTDSRVLVLKADGQLQLVGLTGDGPEALGAAQAKGGLGSLLQDLSRMDFDPDTGRLVIPAGQNVYPFTVDEAGKMTLRGETQIFYDKDETAQLELRVLLLQEHALIFHKVGVVLCNQHLNRLSNTKY